VKIVGRGDMMATGERTGMTSQTELDNTASAVDRALGRMAPQRVREGTGRDWAEWLAVLDGAGAREWDHRGVVDFLEREHPDVPAWWQQSLAVAYERARGRRVVGQTTGVGFQIGAQRSVATSSAHLWKVLVGRPELWLGEGASVVFEPGHRYDVPAWWQQSLAVAYERARGRRVVGQTSGVGFQVGAQRSVATSSAHLWKVLVSRPDLWLGEGASVVFEPGRRYQVPPGELWSRTTGEMVAVKPGDRLRMSWQPEDWPAPAFLQISLTPLAPGRTRLNAFLEKLPDAPTRDVLRVRMHDAMERVALAAEE